MHQSLLLRAMTAGLCLALVFGLTVSCKSRKDKALETDLTAVEGEQETKPPEETTTGEALPDVELENLLFSKATGLQPVYFDFDSAGLNPEALATLRENAEKIKETPGVMIQIEGHCDERGTQEYNIALGERRALAVRAHLIKLGVSGDRLLTISYGEEFPAVEGSNEQAWAKNRRCEFNKAESM